MGFKFALVTGGEVFDSFETAVPDWSASDRVIAGGNVHYRVVSVIPVELAAEVRRRPAKRPARSRTALIRLRIGYPTPLFSWRLTRRFWTDK